MHPVYIAILLGFFFVKKCCIVDRLGNGGKSMPSLECLRDFGERTIKKIVSLGKQGNRSIHTGLASCSSATLAVFCFLEVFTCREWNEPKHSIALSILALCEGRSWTFDVSSIRKLFKTIKWY